MPENQSFGGVKIPIQTFRVKGQFGGLYQNAVNNELQTWKGSAKGQSVLIILLDQFSRMMHRGTALAFAQDNKALEIALYGVNNNFDRSLLPVERVFYYMPLEHTENLEIQNQCIVLFQQLLLDVPEELKPEFQGFLKFAEKHQEIIERFKRFPHRNKPLNRISNAEERLFLTQPDSAF